ncbi:MAG: 6-phosphogluconolactonase [Candidatus Saccharimonadales bacterium]
MNLVTDPTGEKIVTYVASVLTEKLEAGESVLWLVPGGSAMASASRVLENLEDVDTSRLCITLTDERYGAPGHDDENWSQLARLGFVLNSINAYRVLRGEDAETTAADFSHKLEELFETYQYKIGLFGIGADGHTAGIKPHTIAVTSSDLAASFKGEDFERITMTAEAVRRLDEVVAYAHGDEKHQTLRGLLEETVPLTDRPAQVLKEVNKATLFSDLAA